MNKDIEELMQKRIIGEDKILSQMIQDIIPKVEKRFTDLEIEANKSEEFSLVIYKKENIFVRLFKNIKFSIEKYRIMKLSQVFSRAGKARN